MRLDILDSLSRNRFCVEEITLQLNGLVALGQGHGIPLTACRDQGAEEPVEATL